jgi:cold shock CspA family protein
LPTGKAKGPPAPSAGRRASGRILRLVTGQSYGYIRMADRREVFFHRADMAEGTAFNSLEIGDVVVFELIADDISGPRGTRVRKR